MAVDQFKKELLIKTKKNWLLIFYSLIFGLLLLSPLDLLFVGKAESFFEPFLLWEGFELPGFFTFFIMVGMIVYGGILVVMLFNIIFLMPKKVLKFIIESNKLVMSDIPCSDDSDFNKIVLLDKAKNFFLKSKIKWSGHGEFIKKISYQDSDNEEKLFLDLIWPEMMVEKEDIKKILDFINLTKT
ncbi:MAG: hypothetical protein V1716_03865 [Candidatus Uhrbacteria bacterium]